MILFINVAAAYRLFLWQRGTLSTTEPHNRKHFLNLYNDISAPIYLASSYNRYGHPKVATKSVDQLVNINGNRETEIQKEEVLLYVCIMTNLMLQYHK